ncbi:uncharacterized protein LOC112110046 [Terrapene carolina triunguis]|uniref:uncharacterized protein LOC112110046 n=1 Tax=Terrapene triunguis TaxID=2587831 RepID=UPI001156A557|nr:uncharacterized protein LOC112110046 [Terrapene carolina triunguis]
MPLGPGSWGQIKASNTGGEEDPYHIPNPHEPASPPALGSHSHPRHLPIQPILLPWGQTEPAAQRVSHCKLLPFLCREWRLERKMYNFFEDLARKVPPKAKEQLRNLSRPVEKSVTMLWELERKVRPYMDQLHDALVSYTEGPLEMVEHYSKTLLGSQAYSNVPSRVELQEQLGSYAQELGLQEFERSLAAYARDLHQKLSPYAEDLHGWLNSRWDAFMQCFSEETSGGAS